MSEVIRRWNFVTSGITCQKQIENREIENQLARFARLSVSITFSFPKLSENRYPSMTVRAITARSDKRTPRIWRLATRENVRRKLIAGVAASARLPPSSPRSTYVPLTGGSSNSRGRGSSALNAICREARRGAPSIARASSDDNNDPLRCLAFLSLPSSLARSPAPRRRGEGSPAPRR